MQWHVRGRGPLEGALSPRVHVFHNHILMADLANESSETANHESQHHNAAHRIWEHKASSNVVFGDEIAEPDCQDRHVTEIKLSLLSV